MAYEQIDWSAVGMIGLLLLGLVVVFAFMILAINTETGVKLVPSGCEKLCVSHGYTTEDYTVGYQKNDICYCKDSTGAIWTFAM